MRLLEASPCSYFLAAMLILLLPIRLLTAVVLAAAFHELCHLVALAAFSSPIYGIRIKPTGAVIRTDPLSPVQELVCAAAGPMGSLLLLILSDMFPLLAFCGLIQGLFNLLPVYPLDGGRILRQLLSIGKEKFLAKMR